MIEAPVRSRKDPLKPIKMEMEDIKIEFVDLCVMPADGVNFLDMDSDDGSPTEMEVCMSSSDSPGETVRPRKRAKLDHLSPEEKAQHRKMMNRISAQSARDRQKALMTQQDVTIKNMATASESLKKQNAMLVSTTETLTSENKTLKEENERLTTLVFELEAKLKAASENQTTQIADASVASTNQDIKLEVELDDVKDCCGSSLEPAVLRTVPLPKGPQDPLQKLSLMLLLSTLYLGIWTHLKSCNSLENSQKKSLMENNSCQSLSSLTQLQKQLLHKWLLRPRPLGMEQRTPG
ncbi:unnamed protein product [Orchesella dallaii]|uniref:BZIP domain-containing protein n=1 Tax=Orchesella dallaii TaxID=48710 RepID=A0ABP1RW19_9HEXA